MRTQNLLIASVAVLLTACSSPQKLAELSETGLAVALHRNNGTVTQVVVRMLTNEDRCLQLDDEVLADLNGHNLGVDQGGAGSLQVNSYYGIPGSVTGGGCSSPMLMKGQSSVRLDGPMVLTLKDDQTGMQVLAQAPKRDLRPTRSQALAGGDALVFELGAAPGTDILEQLTFIGPGGGHRPQATLAGNQVSTTVPGGGPGQYEYQVVFQVRVPVQVALGVGVPGNEILISETFTGTVIAER